VVDGISDVLAKFIVETRLLIITRMCQSRWHN